MKTTQLKQITIDSMMKKIKTAINDGCSENYFVATVAAGVLGACVCYNTPYNGVKNKYTDDLYMLIPLDEVSEEDYLHIREISSCYPKDSKAAKMAAFYSEEYKRVQRILYEAEIQEDLRSPLDYWDGDNSYNE